MSHAEPAPAGAYLVVVGLSPSTSPYALHWAVGAAAARGGRVRAVRAWRPTPPMAGARGTPSMVTRQTDPEGLARTELAAAVSAVLGVDHGVDVALVVGGRRQVLLAESARADLLVIDAPHLTSASNNPLQLARLVQNAGCPIVVLPPQVSGEPDTAFVRGAKAVGEAVARGAGQSGRPGVRPPALPPHG